LERNGLNKLNSINKNNNYRLTAVVVEELVAYRSNHWPDLQYFLDYCHHPAVKMNEKSVSLS
jgi:hypothetical protein